MPSIERISARFLSPAETEIYTGLSRSTLYRLIAAGVLSARKVGGAY